MKRILAALRRDLLSTAKDQMMIYSIVGTLVMALGLRFFLPSVGQAAVNVVTLEMPPAMVQELEGYLNVEVVDDRAALERRVLAYDDTVGIAPAQGGGYTLVLQGNEAHDSESLPATVLQKVMGGDGQFQVGIRDVEGDQVAFREIIGSFVGLSVLFVSSMVMGFMIIEDKESRMLQALGVSPLSRREYVAARGLLALSLSLILALGSLLLMGLSGFNYLQILAITAVSSLVAILAGFVIGAISGNQISGIANVKFGMLLFILPALLTLVIPERFWAALYWVPTYWTYASFKAVLLEGASWGALAPLLGWTLLTSVVLLAASYRWLKGNLDFARG